MNCRYPKQSRWCCLLSALGIFTSSRIPSPYLYICSTRTYLSSSLQQQIKSSAQTWLCLTHWRKLGISLRHEYGQHGVPLLRVLPVFYTDTASLALLRPLLCSPYYQISNLYAPSPMMPRFDFRVVQSKLLTSSQIVKSTLGYLMDL